MSERPGPSSAELRSSTTGEDFRSVGVVSEEEKSQYAAEIGVDKEDVDNIIKTRNNSTGQLISHGAEVVDNGNGDYALRATDSQVENARRAMNKDLKAREGSPSDTPEAVEASGKKGEGDMAETAENKNQQNAEEAQEMTDSRNEVMAKMYDEGAETRMRAEQDGDTKTFFAPTAEQVDMAHAEMEKDKAEAEAKEQSAEKSKEEIEDLAKQRDEIKDEAESLAEKVEDAELSTQELIALLRAEVASLRERIEELSKSSATPDSVSEEDEEGEEGEEDEEGEEGEEESDVTAEATDSAEETAEVDSHDKAEENYLRLLAGRRKWFFGRPSEQELSEARAIYERSQIDRAMTRAEEIVAEKYPELTGEERERALNVQASAEMAFQKLDRLQQESEIEERSYPRRAMNWLKRHPRLRTFAGLALTGVAVVLGATGNVPGAAACIVGRGALAGLGVGLAVEGGMDLAQTKLNQKLREITPEQLTDMTPDQLNDVVSAMAAYEVRRGQGPEQSRFRESVLNIFAQQEQDIARRMTELEGQGMTPEMARGRALTEHLNAGNIDRENADLDERRRAMIRGIGAGIAGTAVFALSTYFGLNSLNSSQPDVAGEKPGGVPDQPPAEPGPGTIPEAPPPEAAPIIPEIPPEINFTESATSEWDAIGQAITKYSAKNGVELNENQWNIATDYIKDEMNTYNSHPKNWVPNGWSAKFTDSGWSTNLWGRPAEGTRGLKDAINYALTHPNG